jgi:hypothetical protein
MTDKQALGSVAGSAGPQSEEEEFAAPGQRKETCADQSATELRFARRGKDFRPSHFHGADNPATEQGCQVTAKDFDFGQFRHGGKLMATEPW